ncbi:unnamed protein product [Peronospora destructor]|uniref:Transmembrane protein n=1 Tax=Peronospora destructor TaxID=86335 RepID=A0AAV0U715_9STRA|nr:unnamed protein product [Peronospora destructor]
MDFQNYLTPSDKKADVFASKNTIQDIEDLVVENGASQSVYDDEIYGSLRKGGAVKFFSKDCVGLVAATFASASSVECLKCLIQPMLNEHFSLNATRLAASQRLTSVPLAFCFFFGLLSDCYPILGFRRKGYLIIGLGTTMISFFVLSALDGFVESRDGATGGTGLAVAIIMLATLASTGNMMTHMCVLTRVLELSQRERLNMRGAIVATYSMFREVVFIITDALVYALERSSTHHNIVLLVYGLVIGVSIPLVWKSWQEEYYSLSTPMRTRGQILWKVMQQKAVWSILTFICIFTFFGSFALSGPSVIVNYWSGASGDNQFVQQVLYYGAILLTIVVWRYYFMNRPWRTFFAMSTVLLIVPQLIVAICVTQNILRDRYFYRFMSLFSSISTGIGWLASIIPLTEIIQEGSEGAMVGLIVSMYFLVFIFVDSNATGLFKGSNFYNAAEVISDMPEGRSDVLKALLFSYGINAFQLVGLFFLPRQKLDTQQLRSYGGYTKCASAAIVTFAMLLFVYSVAITALALNPSTSHMTVADGCTH